MTTHYGRITHLRESRSSRCRDYPAWPALTHGSVCRATVVMTLKVRAVHGQLNEGGGFDINVTRWRSTNR